LNAVRGEVAGYAMNFSRPIGGSGKLASSVDPSQYAAALDMIRTATSNMQAQYASFQRVFDAVG